MKFSMKCTCGDVMTVDAANKEEAMVKFKDMMTTEMVGKHMAEKHQGEPVPSLEQIQMMITQNVQPVQPTV